MNGRNSVEAVTKAKPSLKPYKNVDDERFNWLERIDCCTTWSVYRQCKSKYVYFVADI